MFETQHNQTSELAVFGRLGSQTGAIALRLAITVGLLVGIVSLFTVVEIRIWSGRELSRIMKSEVGEAFLLERIFVFDSSVEIDSSHAIGDITDLIGRKRTIEPDSFAESRARTEGLREQFWERRNP